MKNTLGSEASGNPEARCVHCGQFIIGSEPWKQRQFALGILLALATSLPILVGFANAFQSISATKTTGMGAVAGGFSEAFVILGIGAIVLFAVSGIVLLVRGFSKKHPFRALLSIIGIVWCGFIWEWFAYRS